MTYQTHINGNGRNGHHVRELPSTIPDKLQPHNIEAEQAVLGSILISSDALIDIEQDNLLPEDFFIERHAWIFETMQQLRSGDLLLLNDTLEQAGRLAKIGGPAYLSELLNVTPTHIMGRHYAKIVKRNATMRRLIDASSKISRLAFESSEEPEEALQKASDILLEVSTGQLRQPKSLSHFCEAYFDRLDQYYQTDSEVIGLPTGLPDLDKILCGLQRGKLILVGGRPGMGKSSLGLQFAMQAAIRQRSSLIFSMEMTGDELVERMVCSHTGIDSDLIRGKKLTDKQWSQLMRVTTNVIPKWPITIDDSTRTIEAMRARIINHYYKYGLDLVLIDYVQRVQTARVSPNRDAEIGIISNILKNLANDLQIPVVAIASLNRSCESRGDKRPILSDMRESGNLEHDADIVIFVYRDVIYNKNTQYPHVAELDVAKWRAGKLGMVKSYFREHTTTFLPLAQGKVD